MVVTVTETEMEETEMEDTADHAKKIHERDSTKATAMKRILASCEDTRSTGHYSVCLVVGFSSVFLPFSNRGKRFFDTNFTKVVLPSPNTCKHHDPPYCFHRIQKANHSW